MVVLDPEPLQAKVVQLVLVETGHEAVIVDSPGILLDEVSQREIYGVVLEVDLPGITGYQLSMEMRTRGYRGPIVLLAQRADTTARLNAFECGADDLMVKPFDPQELCLKVDSIARRCAEADRLVMGSVVRVGNSELRVRDMTFVADGRPPVHLTPTEMRLLEFLMRNSPRTLPRDSLIDRTWPNDFIAAANRVDVFIGRLRRKIEVHANDHLIETVRGVGYAFRPQEKQVLPFRVQPPAGGAASLPR